VTVIVAVSVGTGVGGHPHTIPSSRPLLKSSRISDSSIIADRPGSPGRLPGGNKLNHSSDSSTTGKIIGKYAPSSIFNFVAIN